MKLPTLIQAETLLKEAETMNPGSWVAHNKYAGECARMIANECEGLNPGKAFVLGLLHDIGRREGYCDLMHTLYGYRFMKSLGYDDSARICLTHSFPNKDINIYSGNFDSSFEDTEFIKHYLATLEYDDYDRLIQLCDALTTPDGPCIMEKRFVDVTLRYGFNEFTLIKWKAFLDIKEYFDEKTGKDIYRIVGL